MTGISENNCKMKKISFAAALIIIMASSASSFAFTARIAVVGDIMVHEQQIERAAMAGGGFDFSPSFELVAPILSDADLAVGNFETTLTSSRGAYAGYPCFKSPYALADALKKAGFDLLITANNHCLDGGFSGLRETISSLRGFGFMTTGTYRSEEERKNILVVEVNGIRVAFLNWTYGTNGIRPPQGKEWAVSMLDAGAIAGDIARAKALKPDFIIAMPHVGTEYTEAPTGYVKKIVDEMAAAGADIIIAGHPHVVQPFEFRDRKVFIAWSMGNFISFQRTKPRDVGAILELTLEKSGGVRSVSASVIPTWVQIRQSGGGRTVRVLPVGAALAEPARFGLTQNDMRRLMSARRDFIKNVLQDSASPQDKKIRYAIPR